VECLTDLLPVHYSASMAAQTTCSGVFHDRLVSDHRGFELAGLSLLKLFCVAVGKTERQVYGRGKLTIVYVNVYSAVLPLTRSTGQTPSRTVKVRTLQLGGNRKINGNKYPLYVLSQLYICCRISARISKLPTLLCGTPRPRPIQIGSFPCVPLCQTYDEATRRPI
jgi:hypothetical protein